MAQLQAQGATFWITLMLFWSPSPLKMCSTPCPNGTRRIRGLVPSDAQLGVSRRSHSLDDLGLGSAPKSCSNLACHVQIFVRGHIYQGRSTIPAVKSNLKDVEMSSKGWGFPKLCRVPLIHPHVSITASQSFMPYPYARM